ncbi:clathrin assembly complex beta adaptin component [Scheffersomyces xylosifermentans]|uniref:clathrin assembly complex beta adaptin component n=1 Tax=Scheffersomyces xylosifermentans TaxID=1304137 RepID=UPI00315DD362
MADSFSKISSMLESAKDLTIEAAVSASSRLTDTPSSQRTQEIPKLLNSRVDRDVLNGMKCVISIIARGEDGLPYFADVVKNVSTTNPSIRSLVLIYLTRYGEVEPDTALLSINTIQRSLTEKNPINRAQAIKSLAGIRISSILPIVLLCIKRTVTDPSPLVRSATAIAIGKAFDIEEIESSSRKQLIEFLTKLLSDSDSTVVSAAIKTYYKVKVEFASSSKIWEPIHGNFRRFCSIIKDIDEWSQCFLIDFLTEYCRKFLPKPKLYMANDTNQVIDLPEDYSQIPFPIYEVSFDNDLSLFINSLKILIYSRPESVLLAVSRAVYSLAPPSTFKEFQLNLPLVRIATSQDPHIALFALQTISYISWKDNTIFAPNFKRFYLFPTDSFAVASCKLDILSSLAGENNIKYILEELKYYSLHSRNSAISQEAIRAIGRCSQLSPEWNKKILSWCLKQIKYTNGSILNELLTVVRYLIQQKNNFTVNIANEREDIIHTTYKLSLILQDDSLNYEAKACIIWIIGEFNDVAENSIGPDALRLLVKNFAREVESVRYQILILAAKVASYEVKRIKSEVGDNDFEYNERLSTNINFKMFQHVLNLAKYDSSYDTRDRARMLNVLLNSTSSQAELASLFLQVPKPVPVVTSKNDSNADLTKALSAYLSVRDWSNEANLPSSSIRKEVPVIQNSLSAAGISSVSSTFNKSVSPPPIMSTRSISSESYHNSKPVAASAKQSYHLQSLDEFFGNDEEEDSEVGQSSSAEEDEEENSSTDESSEEEEEEGGEEESDGEDQEDQYEVDDSDASSKKAFLSKGS